MASYEIKDGVGIIPKSAKKIKNRAFEKCTDLTSVVIPEGVTEIGYSAFEGCTALTSVVIPKSVTKIGDGASEEGEEVTINVETTNTPEGMLQGVSFLDSNNINGHRCNPLTTVFSVLTCEAI